MRKGALWIIVGFMMSLMYSPVAWGQAKTIKIGFNLPLTGQIPKVGENSRYAAEMLKAQLNAFGGLKIGGEYYKLEFLYEDNETKADSTVIVTLKLITEDDVIGVIGPQASVQAIPAGEICDAHATPMISAWSTHPATTKDRPLTARIFQACPAFLHRPQAEVDA